MEQVTPWYQTFPCPCLEVQLWCLQRGESSGPLSRGVQRDGQELGCLDLVLALDGAGMQLGLAPPVASPPKGSAVGMAARAQSWLLQDSHFANSSSNPVLNEVEKPPNGCLQQSHRVCIGPPMPTKGKLLGGQLGLLDTGLGVLLLKTTPSPC